MKLLTLNSTALPEISKRLPSPSYERLQRAPGIIHIGVGGFHRAHQAYYIHQLMSQGEGMDWGIQGIGLMASDRKIAEVLQEQDGLYTLITRYPSGEVESEIIGSIMGCIAAVDHQEAALELLSEPQIKIVSLTITEGGYLQTQEGEIDLNHPEVQHDLRHPDQPKTVFGYLTEALRKRRDANLPAFTVLSCDNIIHNGDVARKSLTQFARAQDTALSLWITSHVCFPNSMVDRITPVSTPSDSAYLKSTYGITDRWPVTCEPFLQWIIEDHFSNGRPELEKVGVQFVPDVTPYETMKLQLLNAGHSVLGIPGALCDIATIDACMEDKDLSAFMREFMDREVTPILAPVPGIDLNEYKSALEERFGNPNIKDGVERICSESSAKLPKFLIPTLLLNLERGGSISLATFILAAWCYYSDKEHSYSGRPLIIQDAQQSSLHRAAKDSASDELSFLKQPAIFGDLVKNERFTKKYAQCLKEIYTCGDLQSLMRKTLAKR